MLNSKLDAGSAGDLITCRPFDASLELYNKGKLADLTGLAAMANFSDVAKVAWSTDDSAHTFCVPMASVIHGFIYNKAAFEEVGVTPPTTEAEFFAVLDKIKENGSYIPMAMGTNDQWEAATMGYQNIGPNYWKGEEGRLALIKGEQKLTDDDWVAAVPRDRQVEGLSRRRLRGADLSRQPEPLHPRPRRDLPGRLLGDRAVPRPDRRRLRDGRLPAAGAGTPATTATSPTTSTSRWA